MQVFVLENAPPRLRGYLSRLFVEIRSNVFIGQYSVRVRERVWEIVKSKIEKGNAILAWSTNDDIGFAFDTCGENRRMPIDFDGLRLVKFVSLETDVPF
jgi:CRISPR-associated protein Cas2